MLININRLRIQTRDSEKSVSEFANSKLRALFCYATKDFSSLAKKSALSILWYILTLPFIDHLVVKILQERNKDNIRHDLTTA